MNRIRVWLATAVCALVGAMLTVTAALIAASAQGDPALRAGMALVIVATAAVAVGSARKLAYD